jgi:hypothetical protein
VEELRDCWCFTVKRPSIFLDEFLTTLKNGSFRVGWFVSWPSSSSIMLGGISWNVTTIERRLRREGSCGLGGVAITVTPPDMSEPHERREAIPILQRERGGWKHRYNQKEQANHVETATAHRRLFAH